MAKNLYNMNRAKRGIALVINIRTYDPNTYNLTERKWSEPDVENLKQSLQYLEFDLKLHENLKANEIRDEIQKIAEIDHSNSDCFLCVVMSHGEDGKIIASDSEEISFKEIMAPIKSCVSLENKPKLFFFQACRGDKEMDAKSKRPDSGVSTSSGHEPTDHNDVSTFKNKKMDAPKQNTKQETKSEPKQRTKIESEADLLVYYSTIPDHYSYGTVAEGTFFIRSVCKELNEAYKNLPNNMSLDVMIKNINESVKGSEMQLAEILDRFSGTVYFQPKSVSFDFES
jgi:hypothetical protein